MFGIDLGYCPVLYKERMEEWVSMKRKSLYVHLEKLNITDDQVKSLVEDWWCEDGDYKERMNAWNLDNDDIIILDSDDGAHRDLYDQLDSERYLDYLMDCYDM